MIATSSEQARSAPAPDSQVERREVLVVGGGPAGAAVAIGLARRGRDVVLVERTPIWHWRACGVFTSPATMDALGRLGLQKQSSTRWPVACQRCASRPGRGRASA